LAVLSPLHPLRAAALSPYPTLFRSTELARAIRDERWERTTQSTLAEAAQLQAEAVEIQEEMARIAGAGDAGRPKLHPELLRSPRDRKSTRLNSSHGRTSYAVSCMKK